MSDSDSSPEILVLLIAGLVVAPVFVFCYLALVAFGF